MRNEGVRLMDDSSSSTPLANGKKRSYRTVFITGGVIVVLTIFIIIIIFLISAPTPSPKPESNLVTKETLQGVEKISFSSLSKNDTSLFDRIAWLTDTYGPRFSGSDALENAITGLSDKIMKEDGLETETEPVLVPKWVRGIEFANMIQPRAKKINMVGLGQSNSTYTVNGTKGPIQAEVIAVASFDELIQRKAEAAGKIVLFNVPWVSYGFNSPYRRNAATQAGDAGAIGVLLRSVTPYSMQSPHTGSSVTAKIAAAAISVEDALQIQRMIDRGQTVVVEMQVDLTQFPDSPSRNLIVKYPGTKFPDEYVIIGGHIDSWDIAEGAMDDAGGALLGWEAIRLLKESNLQPDRTILAVMFTNEENGLRGAQAFAANRKNISQKISLALESDSGPFQIYGIYVNATKESIDILSTIADLAFADVTDPQGRKLPGGRVVATPELGPDIGELSAFGISTGFMTPIDVLASNGGPCRDVLADAAVPLTAVSATRYPGYFWYHHTTADTVDKLNPRDLQLSAASLAVWAYTVANLPMILPQRDN